MNICENDYLIQKNKMTFFIRRFTLYKINVLNSYLFTSLVEASSKIYNIKLPTRAKLCI